MTISSSLNAGVMGLSVNATRLAAISDNIANSATYGYKRADVDFSSMVINQRRSIYSAGGVRAQAYKDVESSSALISTGNAMDVSVNGRGMLPVTDAFSVNHLNERNKFMMTPTGSFSPDKNGFLRTSSGLFLLGWPANSSGEIGEVRRDSSSELVPVDINVAQFASSPTRQVDLGLNLPADATLPDGTGVPYSLPIEYYDNLGRPQSLTYEFSPVIDPAGPSNAWTIEVFDGAGDPTTPVATFDMTFYDTIGRGGSIESVTPGAGTTYDEITGLVSFDVLSGPMDTFIGKPEASGGMTQFAGAFSPDNVTKDGSPIGTVQSLEITEQGYVVAIYNSGFRKTLYQVPVVEVANMNGLNALNDQAYSISTDSGEFYLWDPGTGPTGVIAGFTLMESSSDIASELTSLIKTQRAYSSNAKIIQTVDEMLQETTNLKR